MSNLEEYALRISALHDDDLDSWLGKALRDQVFLPRVGAFEYPHIALCRIERDLCDVTRKSFRDSCARLVQRYMDHPMTVEHTDMYVCELLRLSTALKLGCDLEGAFGTVDAVTVLPGRQPEYVLETMIDQGILLSLPFWQQICQHDPRRFGVQAFSGLLRLDRDAAIAVLPLLPDDEIFGDALHAVLMHYDELAR